MTDDDLPASIGRPALGALRAAGIDRLSEVARHREDQLLALHGVGPKAVRLCEPSWPSAVCGSPATDRQPPPRPRSAADTPWPVAARGTPR